MGGGTEDREPLLVGRRVGGGTYCHAKNFNATWGGNFCRPGDLQVQREDFCKPESRQSSSNYTFDSALFIAVGMK